MTGVLLLQLSPGATLVELSGASDDEANAAAVALADSLQVPAEEGLLDVIPGARSLLILFDPERLDHDVLTRRLLGGVPGAGARKGPGRTVRIPVSYGGADGPDLEPLAAERGIPSEELARRHASGRYRVGFLGFAPGFAYLSGLPPDLAVPRLPTPRTTVPPGSVAIGGGYTGVYPGGTAGGWRLIGRTSARVFDEQKDPPCLLRPGDDVVFEAAGDRKGAEPAAADPRRPSEEPRPVFRVRRPGVFTSVQGLPRFGGAAWGIPPGGAMDLLALLEGNSILGNPPGAGALEIALSGPTLEVLLDVRVCLCGADVAASPGATPMAPGSPRRLRAGDRLEFGPVIGGTRAYLCVEGGLRAPGRLGLTRRLSTGDEVAQGLPPGSPAVARSGPDPASGSGGDVAVRVVMDPRAPARIGPGGISLFLDSPYRVSAASDRRGIRLEGAPVSPRESSGVPHEGTALGTIQVPGDGMPILLGPDRPVTGGYAKLGTIVQPDFALVARARPGVSLRFRQVTLSEALAAGSSIRWQ